MTCTHAACRPGSPVRCGRRGGCPRLGHLHSRGGGPIPAGGVWDRLALYSSHAAVRLSLRCPWACLILNAALGRGEPPWAWVCCLLQRIIPGVLAGSCTLSTGCRLGFCLPGWSWQCFGCWVTRSERTQPRSACLWQMVELFPCRGRADEWGMCCTLTTNHMAFHA